MNNPFDVIDARLSNIENLLLDIKHGPIKKSDTQTSPDRINKEEAISFLESKGFALSQSLFYKATSLHEIPCVKFGRRLLFNQVDLISWAESRCISKNTRNSEVSKVLAKSANRKRRS